MAEVGQDRGFEVTVRSAGAEKGWMDGEQAFRVLSGDSFAIAMSQLRQIVDGLPAVESNSAWCVEEMKLTVEITAEGGLRLIGAVGMSVTGGIEVTLKRRG